MALQHPEKGVWYIQLLSLDEIKDQIKKEAFELGFTEISFTPIEELTKEIQSYQEWIDDSNHADMLWMEKNIDKREDPRKLLPEAKSVIVLLTNYNTEETPQDKEGYGKIARYARGKDYHNVIGKRLKKLSRKINENFNSKTRHYVDTGPVLERQWAVKAGLGWQGKNTLLLNRKLGSYFFISVIFTELEFDYPKLISDHCGKCNKCIDACPTNAITPYKVDARKCISYWTIESKEDEIEKNISKNQNNWIFGCDICQEVCPWNNHRVPLTQDPSFLPRNNKSELELKSILNMQEEEFSIRFQNSPIKRPKLKGMKRNAKSIVNNSKKSL